MPNEPVNVCPVCGQEFGAKHKFCVTHGVALLVKVGGNGAGPLSVEVRRCSRCGTEARKGWRFCIKCRDELPSSETVREAASFDQGIAVKTPGGSALSHEVVASESDRPVEAAAVPPASAERIGLTDDTSGPAQAQTVPPAEATRSQIYEGVAGYVPPEPEPSAVLTGPHVAQASHSASISSPSPATVRSPDDPLVEESAPSDSKSLDLRKISLVAGACIVTVLLGAVILTLYVSGSGRGVEDTRAENMRPDTRTDARQTAAAAAPPSAPEIPRPTPPAGMVYVPGGTFLMGRDDGDEYERPAHSVTVKPFYIDENEVTCEQYAEFVRATGQPPPTTWAGGSYSPGHARKPVTGVSWVDANAYALWAGKRLPTEEEWEFAARGQDGRRYPWGFEWRGDIVNAESDRRNFDDVGARPENASPFGVKDMAGNAWEWTASAVTAYPGGTLPTQPRGVQKILRGGSWQSNREQATATYRYGWPAQGGSDYNNAGFRCAVSAEQPPHRDR